MIVVEHLTKRFGGVTAIDDVGFEVAEGEVLGLLGPNGAGKTTTMRIICGLLVPTSGRVVVRGIDAQASPLALRRMIGYLPEGVPLYEEMTVEAFLRFVAEAKDLEGERRRKAVDRAVEECGLSGVRGRLIGHLSRGFRQRVGIAQAVLGDPPVLVFDEPTLGLDPQQNVEIRRLIRSMVAQATPQKNQRTIILSTHILPEVSATCDRVVILSEGRVRAASTLAELASRGQTLEDAFLQAVAGEATS